jgi:hypothetical protein
MKKDATGTIRINSEVKKDLSSKGITIQSIIDLYVATQYQEKNSINPYSDTEFYKNGASIKVCNYCHEKKLTIDTGMNNICKPCFLEEEA